MEKPTVTNGHLIFTNIVMVAELLITMFANNLKKKLRIYKNLKKITTVNSVCDSYQNLLQTLSSNQKEDEKNLIDIRFFILITVLPYLFQPIHPL